MHTLSSQMKEEGFEMCFLASFGANIVIYNHSKQYHKNGIISGLIPEQLILPELRTRDQTNKT